MAIVLRIVQSYDDNLLPNDHRIDTVTSVSLPTQDERGSAFRLKFGICRYHADRSSNYSSLNTEGVK